MHQLMIVQSKRQQNKDDPSIGHHLKLNPSWDLFNFKRLMGPISVFESRSRDDKSELNRIKQFKTHQL